VDELHDNHRRKVGGSSRTRPAPMIHLPRPYALVPDDGPEWVTVAEPKLVHGDICQLLITARVPAEEAPESDKGATTPS
jgi:hypothetical protein